MKKEICYFGNLRLCDISDDVPKEWDIDGEDHVRVQLPASASSVVEMQRKGFLWVDRTMGVTINLARSAVDYQKLIRMPIEESDQWREDVLRIAKGSFPYDRRFHICADCDSKVSEVVLKSWVDALESTLICFYKEVPIGFLSLKWLDGEKAFVHLAAVEERYRMTGAAMSLYSKAAVIAKEKGCRKLCGRISTMNTAVGNLYAFLGAAFEEPLDIFLKEKAHGA